MNKSILPGQRSVVVCLSMCAAIWAWPGGTPHSAAAIVTWDGGGGTNNWSTGQNWAGDVPPTANDSVLFDGATRTSPVNDLAAGTAITNVEFAATAAPFIVGGNSIMLTGAITDNSPAPQMVNLPIVLTTTHTVNVTTGGSLTLGGAISGVGTLTKSGDGLVTIAGTTTPDSNTVLDGGTVAFGIDNALGNLAFGASTAVPFSTTPSTLDTSNSNLTTTGLDIRVNSAGMNSIVVGNGKTLTINGPVSIGPNTSGLAISGVLTLLNVTGSNGSVVVNTTGNFSVGLPRLNADTGNDPFTTVDLSALKSFTYNADTSAGELRVGGGNSRGILLLAGTSNTITAAIVHVSNSSVAPASGNNNGGTSRLGLGAGTNVINTDLLNVGGGKSPGIFDFQSATGTLTLAGRGGNPVNITLGNQNSATGSNTVTQFSLAGHMVNVQAGTVLVGRMGGATGGTGAAAITFDTGEFKVVSLQLAVNASGTAANGAVGTFTLGSDSTSTGVLNVTGEFFLANRTNTAQLTSPANGTFTINGGTANIGADIIDASTAGDPSTRTTTINLLGGTLNMMGHAIGSAAAPITTVVFADAGQATLANLGSTGINGAGLKLSNTGTLVVEGANGYSGATTIERGTLLLNGSIEGTSNIALGDGTLRLGAANRIVDAATVTLTNGKFATGGFSETLGAVTLGGPVRLELGNGASVVHFAGSSAATWSGMLSVYEWSGSPAGGGTDQLFFGNNATGLTPGQLAQVQFVDPFGAGSGVMGARILATGELIPIPEPASVLSSFAGLGVMFLRRRQRSGERSERERR